LMSRQKETRYLILCVIYIHTFFHVGRTSIRKFIIYKYIYTYIHIYIYIHIYVNHLAMGPRNVVRGGRVYSSIPENRNWLVEPQPAFLATNRFVFFRQKRQ